eukprot:2207052-Ditylum_brightwellii.AAC.1
MPIYLEALEIKRLHLGNDLEVVVNILGCDDLNGVELLQNVDVEQGLIKCEMLMLMTQHQIS